MEEQRSRVKKILSVLLDILIYFVIIVSAFAVILTITSKRGEDGAINMFGIQMRVVISPSMEKCDETDVSMYQIKDIPVRSMVFIQLVPEDEEEAKEWYSKLKVGDVLTFRYKYDQQETITHRIVDIEQKSTGGYVFSLEGDNKNSDVKTLTQTIDTDLSDTSFNYVIGKVTGQSRLLGFIVFSLKQPLSMVFLIIVPCAIIITLEVIRIIRLFSVDRKKRIEEEKLKNDAEKQKQADEIEELKKQLAALQSGALSQNKPQEAEITQGDSESPAQVNDKESNEESTENETQTDETDNQQ